jgi:hypothetical protein
MAVCSVGFPFLLPAVRSQRDRAGELARPAGRARRDRARDAGHRRGHAKEHGERGRRRAAHAVVSHDVADLVQDPGQFVLVVQESSPRLT